MQPETGAGLSGVTAVAVGQDHSLALMQDGTVVEWGNLLVEDIHDNWHVIGPPAGLSNVVAIAAEGTASLALQQDGTVVAWGYEQYPGYPFTEMSFWTGVVAIAASDNHWLALNQDGSVVGWYDTAGAEETPTGLAGVVGIAAGPATAWRLSRTAQLWLGAPARAYSPELTTKGSQSSPMVSPMSSLSPPEGPEPGAQTGRDGCRMGGQRLWPIHGARRASLGPCTCDGRRARNGAG